MTGLLFAMIVALLIPIYEACQDKDIWQKMLAFASIATKTSLMILVISVIRDDWMIGLVGVLILSVGNASLMLLAHILRRASTIGAPQESAATGANSEPDKEIGQEIEWRRNEA
ncbi:MAG: hypothetical protein AAFZ17_12865 [Cyanobacteria bacterium J06650_10]